MSRAKDTNLNRKKMGVVNKLGSSFSGPIGLKRSLVQKLKNASSVGKGTSLCKVTGCAYLYLYI